MDVQSINRQTLPVSQLIRAQVGTGRISLPVEGSQVYANLKHINGIGGFGNQPAYSLSQLRSLDNLIDRLKLLKGEKFTGSDKLPGNGKELEQMIDTYRKELYMSLHSRPAGVYSPGFTTAGLSLDLTA